MKKLLALVLVLALAGSVQAGFLLSVNGEVAPDEIFDVLPSDYIPLDILIDPETVFNGADFEIRVSGLGSIDAANLAFGAPTSRTFNSMVGYYLTDNAGWGGTSIDAANTPQNVKFGALDFSVNMMNNAEEMPELGGGFIPGVVALSYPVFADGLMFHCEGEGDVIIELVTGGVSSIVETPSGYDTNAPFESIIQAGTVLDTIIIHQIPEPMTLSLLAMGGLALLRRRR